MSNIELNATNIKKFSKRLHKHATEKGLDISLSESQELFAKSLGHTNYHNLCNSIVEKENLFAKKKEIVFKENITESYSYSEIHNKMNDINQKIVEKLIKEKRDITVEEQVEVFYEKFLLVLNAKESGIANCYLEKNKDKKYDYNFIFTTIYNDKPYINLFSSVEYNYKSLIDSGMKEQDTRYIMRSFNIYGRNPISGDENDHSIKINKRFDIIEFSEKLWQFLNNKTKSNERYMFKCGEHTEIDNLTCLNNKYYRTMTKDISTNESHYFKDLKSLAVEGIYKGKECYKLDKNFLGNKIATNESRKEPVKLDFSSIIILYSFDVLPDEQGEFLFIIDK